MTKVERCAGRNATLNKLLAKSNKKYGTIIAEEREKSIDRVHTVQYTVSKHVNIQY